MPGIVWDRVGERVFETGLDRGVLYLPDGSLVPWNGLTSVIEQFNKETSPVYYDGMKISDSVVLGEFSATLRAVTYPDEFLELEGLDSPRRGTFYGDQAPKTFGLCYRTRIGNDLEGDSSGYKIHVLYNVTAIPREKTYASVSNDPSLVEFEWDITAVPEEVPGFHPTAHLVFDSRYIDPWLLEDLESILYGEILADAILMSMQELVTYINEWYRIKIVDNGDGTWTATSQREGIIFVSYDDIITILGANAVYLNDTTYQISDTNDLSDVPQIKITDNEDGTWTAETDQAGLISLVGYEFEILNANAEYLSPVLYEVEDTIG